MALETTINSKKTGETFRVITENYITGTYMVVEPGTNQTSIRKRADKIHKELRDKAGKLGDTWTGDSEEYIKENVREFWEKNKEYQDTWNKGKI